MPYIFKLGPVETDEGPSSFYFTLGEEGFHFIEGSDDVAALRQIAQREGKDMLCEPALEAAASKLDLPTAELPDFFACTKATLAVSFSHGTLMEKVEDPPLLWELIQAAEAFELAQPWDIFGGDEAVEIEVEGALSRTFEACIMGQAGEEFGLALYFEKGSVARLARFSDEGRMEDVASLDSMVLLLDDEPQFVLDAVAAVSELSSAPLVMRMKRGEPKEVDEKEIRALIAALRAVADYCEDGKGRGESTSGRRTTARLRRVDSPEPEPPSALPFARVGRNEPCPCGSGKKFKKCHLATEAPSAVQGAAALHDRDRRVTTTLMEYAVRRFGKERMKRHLVEPFGQRAPSPQLTESLACYVTPIEGKPLAADYLEEKPAAVSEDDRAWMEAQLATGLGLWEVLRVEEGRGIEAVDLLSSERRFIDEVRGSTGLWPRNLVLGRVVTFEGTSVFCGVHDQPLRPRDAQSLVAKARDERKAHGGQLPAPRLLELWNEAVSSMALAAAATGKVTNTDGEAIRFVEQEFKLTEGDRDEVVARILAREEVHLDEDSPNATSLTFTRQGNAMHSSWKNTSLASVRITKTRLKLTANSVERADRFTELIQELLGRLAKRGSRKEQAPPDFRGHESVALDAQVLGSRPDPAFMVRDHLAAWLDEPVPALEGRSPRQAAQSESTREALHWLLKEMECVKPSADSTTPIDASWLRRELGLTELGEGSPHHELDLALGAGRKISETLLDFARPLFEDESAADEKQMKDSLGLAIIAWNAAVEQEERPAAIGEARRLLARSPSSATALRRFDELVKRKRERFAHDRRIVGRYEVRKKRGELGVKMEACVAPELAARLEAAGIRPDGPATFDSIAH